MFLWAADPLWWAAPCRRFEPDELPVGAARSVAVAGFVSCVRRRRPRAVRLAVTSRERRATTCCARDASKRAVKLRSVLP